MKSSGVHAESLDALRVPLYISPDTEDLALQRILNGNMDIQLKNLLILQEVQFSATISTAAYDLLHDSILWRQVCVKIALDMLPILNQWKLVL
jgi:hypothetical protein